MRPVFLLALVPLLGACVDFKTKVAEGIPPVSTEVTANKPVYCYSTRAKPDCYDRPLIGQEYRLVNYYGPAPSRVGFSSK
jgi:hypothetical protein